MGRDVLVSLALGNRQLHIIQIHFREPGKLAFQHVWPLPRHASVLLVGLNSFGRCLACVRRARRDILPRIYGGSSQMRPIHSLLCIADEM